MQKQEQIQKIADKLEELAGLWQDFLNEKVCPDISCSKCDLSKFGLCNLTEEILEKRERMIVVFDLLNSEEQ
jgi:hypothetical protein